jgi:ribosome-associated heat shock protein Hsp15
MSEHQRLDSFLWHTRFASQRKDCAALAASGLVRINHQRTDKPHAKVHVGDILTIPLHARVAVIRVLCLLDRRGPATVARRAYEDLTGT